MKCLAVCSPTTFSPSEGWNRNNKIAAISTLAISILLAAIGTVTLVQGSSGVFTSIGNGGTYAFIGLGSVGLIASLTFIALVTYKKYKESKANIQSSQRAATPTKMPREIEKSSGAPTAEPQKISLDIVRNTMISQKIRAVNKIESMITYRLNMIQIKEFMKPGQYWNIVDIESGYSFLFIKENDVVEEFCYKKDNAGDVQGLIEKTALTNAHAIFTLSRLLPYEANKKKDSYQKSLDVALKLKDKQHNLKSNDVYIHEFQDFKVLYLCYEDNKKIDFMKYYFTKEMGIEDIEKVFKKEWKRRTDITII